MIDVFRLTKIKLIELINRPLILVMMIVLPILLGSIAGVSNVRNTGKDIFLAIVDEDQTDASARVIEDLRAKEWHIDLTDDDSAQRRLLLNDVDGVLTIRKGFEANLDQIEVSYLYYVEAEGSMVTTMVREVIVASVLPLFSERSMVDKLTVLYENNGQTPPPDLAERLRDRIEKLRNEQAKIEIEYLGDLVIAPTLTFVVSDYSMEVFFLSIYAILGSLALNRAAQRKRLGASAYGLPKDYVATILSLIIIGSAQIALYSVFMLVLMNQSINIINLLILFVFLILILGIGQLLSLIEESLRLYLSLMLLLFSAVIGGCFFQLSSGLLMKYGQYSPHGWVLSTLRGTRVTPIWVVLMFSLTILILGYFAHKHRIAKETDNS
ncbi:MAG: ABC transporter permease [Clostridiaceae bacterium]|nr:ABC transporter permease [Clostridiaceae bacterium]